MVLAVMLAAAFSVTVVADSSDAAVIDDIEEPALPADLAEGTVICTVDGDEFTDFAAAITAATESNKPIILNNNYNCTIETIDFTGDLEINLNGHTLAVNLIELTGEESITISNGSLLGKSVDDFLHSTITARGNASITLDDVDYYTEATGAIAYDNSSITVRNGTVIHAVGFGLGTNAGDPLGYDVKVTVTDSAVYADSDPTKAGTAILFNVPGLLTITDSTIHGYYQGVIVRGGNAIITGSTITNTLGERVTVDNYESKDWEDGNAVPTSALVIGNKTASAYQYPTSVSITGTEVVTNGAKAVQAYTVTINANSGDGLGVDFVYDGKSSFTNTGKADGASDITYDTSDDNIAVGNPVAMIGDRQFASLSYAVDAASKMTGDVTITIVGGFDLSDSFEDPELSFDLSDSDITSLRIQGSGETASFKSGVDGNNIDGPTYCPAVRFTLPDGAELTIDGITFLDDLWIDNNSGPVSFTGCTFHGSISAYPQSDRVTFDHNIFDFYGTPSEFYTHNAYPMWFKINGSDVGTTFNLVFTNNDVNGYRGVHVESRPGSTVNMTVTDNIFTLSDTDNTNKTIALQLVNQMSGKVVFTGNTVDAYMAVCLFKDVNFTGTIEYADNDLQNGCKAFGSSEWNSGAEAADDFAASLLPARIGDVYYPSLADAIDAVQNGQTITLLDDVTETVTIDSGIDLTLDLNGHKLHYVGKIPYNQGGDETINIVNGTLTITDSSEWSVTANEEYNVTYNGTGSVTYNGSGRAIKVSGENAHLIVNGGYIHSVGGDGIYVTGNTTPDGAAWKCSVTMNGGYVHSTEYGIGVAGKGAILTMNGGYVEADNNAAIGGNGTSNGSSFKGGTVVTVAGGTVIGNITPSSGYISCGIYHPQAGTLTISGGTIVSTNGVGVLMRGGQMEMTGGTIIVQTEGGSGWVGDNKNDVSPNGIVLDGAADYYDYANSSVKVSEGSIEATTPVSVTENPDIPSTGKVQVSGGTYTGAVDETFIAEGYVLTGSEGSYSVVKQLTVSFVNGDQTTTQTVVSGGNVTVPSVTDPEGFGHVWSDGSLTYTDSEVAAMEIEEDITFEISYILELPEVTIDSDNSDPVVGDNVVLTASVSNMAEGATYSYEWSDGTSGDSLTVTSSGEYTVTVTVSYDEQTETGSANITLTFGQNTTTDEDGTETTITENEDGSVTTTVTRPDGSKTETTESTIGDDIKTETVVETPAGSSDPHTVTTVVTVPVGGTVSDEVVNEVIEKIDNSASGDADKTLAFVSETSESVDIPTSSLSDISDSGVSLSLTSNDVTVTFSPSTLETISQMVEETGATSLKSTAENASGNLNQSQSATVGDATVYDVSAFLVDENDEVLMQVSRLGDMTPVTIPYDLPTGISPEDVVVYYMDDYGNLTSRTTVYEDGMVTFWTEHFSYYVIGDRSMVADEPDTPVYPPFIPGDDDDVYIPPTIVVDESSSDDDESVKIAACAAAAVAAAILAVLAIALYRKD
ncbi:MAG: hypothetical protein A3205_04475 [Methanomassiliicoccales archaeon Mx-03]|nr:MAG: hypothetical protein A3205_04475 [Methanomassiliicoccales archaeon Mx-03]